MTRLLLELGADINAVGGTFRTALQSAIRFKESNTAKLLIDEGANVNTVGGWFCTAIQAAAVMASIADMDLLLKAGADVDIEGGYYGSPLQAVCRFGTPLHIKLLLERGSKSTFMSDATAIRSRPQRRKAYWRTWRFFSNTMLMSMPREADTARHFRLCAALTFGFTFAGAPSWGP